MRISDWSSDVCSSDLVARALRIPYVVAEASVAYKRAAGPWAASHRVVLDALDQAAAVITLNPLDAKLIPDQTRVRPLKPFLDTAPFDPVRQLPRHSRAAPAHEPQPAPAPPCPPPHQMH